MFELRAPLQAHIVHCQAQVGDAVQAGQVLLVLEQLQLNSNQEHDRQLLKLVLWNMMVQLFIVLWLHLLVV